MDVRIDGSPSLISETPAQHGQGVVMSGDEQELERIAGGIADDASLDWRLLAKLDGRAADTGDGLRELSQLAQVFRGVQLRATPAAGRKSLFQFAGLEVLEQLGSGAQGEVYRAYDPMLDQDVALKLRRVNSDALSHQFLAEGRRLARVRQANIVSVFGAAAQDGRVGLWTELVRGKSLAELLADEGPLTPVEVTQIGIELCNALAAVHAHGLTHGDIKAENVLRDVSGRIVLADFGAAREIDANDQFGTISGTRHYLAPELIAGEVASPASDQYALGVLLYRLLSSAFPYPSVEDLDSLHMQQVAQSRLPLRRLCPTAPRALISAIERTLAYEPGRRHAGVRVLQSALESSLRPFRFGALHAASALVVILASVLATVLVWPDRLQLQLQSSFYRVGAQSREQLVDGALVGLGDRLLLEVSSNQPTWVYLFNDDGAAAPAVLFPLAGTLPANPLTAHTRWQLPGSDSRSSLSWQVDREADRETFILVASSHPLDEVERRVADWQHAQTGESALVSRGVTTLARLAPGVGERGVQLSTLLAQLGCDRGAADLRCERYVFPHRGR
ncbi:MAG: protein kinase [Tahibacter sp.]